MKKNRILGVKHLIIWNVKPASVSLSNKIEPTNYLVKTRLLSGSNYEGIVLNMSIRMIPNLHIHVTVLHVRLGLTMKAVCSGVT